MDRSCNQFLSSASLALNQHRAIHRCNQVYLFKDLSESGALTDHFSFAQIPHDNVSFTVHWPQAPARIRLASRGFHSECVGTHGLTMRDRSSRIITPSRIFELPRSEM